MAYKDFKTQLDAYLTSNWTTTPIRDYLNLAGKETGYDAWISYQLISSKDSVYTIASGPSCLLAEYLIEFKIFTASASGSTEAIDLSEELKGLLVGTQIYPNMTCLSSDGPEFEGKDQQASGKWFVTSLVFDFEHRYKKP